jgi:hypothetical protein
MRSFEINIPEFTLPKLSVSLPESDEIRRALKARIPAQKWTSKPTTYVGVAIVVVLLIVLVIVARKRGASSRTADVAHSESGGESVVSGGDDS